MLGLFSDLVFLCYLLSAAPKLLFDRMVKGKKHPGLLQRLGIKIPTPTTPFVIWIHAVSVGEVKAAKPLLNQLKSKYRNAFFVITTTTETGQKEARRFLKADAFSYLPLDLSFIVKRAVKKLRPNLFITIEGDSWPNLLNAVQISGGKTLIVSAKLSEKSAKRFSFVPFLAKKLFSKFDLIISQNEEHEKRFLPFVCPSRLHIGGNLKLDIEQETVDISFWKEKFSLPTITISSTHDPEEELLVDRLLSDEWILFLAPRHPERFELVAQLLMKKNIPFVRWSQLELKQGHERLILVDAMGQLPICYSLSRLAVMGGSYVPHVGGHNILEPCLYGIPVLFGPAMHSQGELVSRALSHGAGIQIQLEALRPTVETFFKNPIQEEKMRASALALTQSGRGSAKRTVALFEKHLGIKHFSC